MKIKKNKKTLVIFTQKYKYKTKNSQYLLKIYTQDKGYPDSYI